MARHDCANLNNALYIASNQYIVFVVDMYGDGKYTDNREDAKRWSSELKSRPFEGIKRSNIALNTSIKEAPNRGIGDTSKLAVVGFYFGGVNALELARSGANVSAVVCIHGNLVSSNPTIQK